MFLGERFTWPRIAFVVAGLTGMLLIVQPGAVLGPKDHSTLLHSERVASLAARLAEAMGWPRLRISSLRETALIHDVGKIGVPSEVRSKAGVLTGSEYEIMKGHALLGAAISAEVP